jgi:hypothetical protein
MQAERREKRVWERLIQSYGSRVAEAYGPEMPKPWSDAIADLTDEQIAYGLRKVNRDTPIYPPTLGQFVAACIDMPSAAIITGPSVQSILSAYAVLTVGARLHLMQFSFPWTYLYREWIDEEKPKHAQRQAECVGLLIPAWGSEHPEYRIMVIDMLADSDGHARAVESFKPGVQHAKA